jgi:hypothetical protein
VVWSPLHGVVDFLECELMRRLCRTLLHFLFHLKIDGAIFCAMVGFIAMVHAIWRFHCVWASTAPAAMVRSSASLVVLGRGIFDGKPLGFFPVKALRSSSPSFLVAHTIRVNVVHRLWVVVFVITVTGSWSFVWFCSFPLLLEFTEMLDL